MVRAQWYSTMPLGRELFALLPRGIVLFYVCGLVHGDRRLFLVFCIFLRPLRSSKGAVLVAVAEVDEAADGAPDDEADPGLVGEVGHAAGQRKVRWTSGFVTRSTRTPSEATVNAESVPMFAISAMSPMGASPAMMETKTAPATVTM